MAKYYFSFKAQEDLSNIWAYTFKEWSEKQADYYYELLLENCQNLVERPHLGKNYNQIMWDLRGKVVGKHIIFYQIMNNGDIRVFRILHVRMDFNQNLFR